MRGRKTSLVVVLSDSERSELESWLRSTRLRAGLVRRGRIVLLCAAGHSISEIARRVSITRKIVRRWIERFLKKRLAGLPDKSGRGRRPVFSPRSRTTPGQDRLRNARPCGPVAVAMGL